MDYDARLSAIVSKPKNRECADCRARNPRWVSASLGVFVCIRCCGFHRRLGTHISKIKSTTLDKWSPQMLLVFQGLDNQICNAYWEHGLTNDVRRLNESSSDYQVQKFLRDKYQKKLWIPQGQKTPVQKILDGDNEPKVVKQKVPEQPAVKQQEVNLLDGYGGQQAWTGPPPVWEQPRGLQNTQNTPNIQPIQQRAIQQVPVQQPTQQVFVQQTPIQQPIQQTPVYQPIQQVPIQQPPQQAVYQQPVFPQQPFPQQPVSQPTLQVAQNAFPQFNLQNEVEKNQKIQQVMAMYTQQVSHVQPAPQQPQQSTFQPLGALAAQQFLSTPQYRPYFQLDK